MRRKFRKIDRAIDRIGYWSGGFTLVTSAFAWLGSNLQFLQPYGWPEYVLFGVAVAVVLSLVLSLGMIAWRYLNPLPQVAAEPPMTPSAVSSGDDKFSATVTVSDPPPFEPRGLYMAEMHVDAQKLAAEHVLEVAYRGFNASGRAISLLSIDGKAIWDGGSSSDKSGETSGLSYLRGRGPAEWSNFSEFMIVMTAPVKPNDATAMLSVLQDDGMIYIRFKELDITVESGAGRFRRTARLPITSGATVRKSGDEFRCGRLVDASVVIGLGAASASG